MGKLPLRVLRRASALGVPVVAIGGRVTIAHNPGFVKMIAVSPAGLPPEAAMRPATASENIRKAVADLLSQARHSGHVLPFVADLYRIPDKKPVKTALVGVYGAERQCVACGVHDHHRVHGSVQDGSFRTAGLRSAASRQQDAACN